MLTHELVFISQYIWFKGDKKKETPGAGQPCWGKGTSRPDMATGPSRALLRKVGIKLCESLPEYGSYGYGKHPQFFTLEKSLFVRSFANF